MSDASSIEKCYLLTKKLYTKIKKDPGIFVSQEKTKKEVRDLCLFWFREIKIQELAGVHADIIEKYNSAYRKLLNLTLNNNRRTSYVQIMSAIVSSYNTDIFLPSITRSKQNDTPIQIWDFASGLSEEELDYITESVGCANNKFYRAATILGWCAAVNRMHDSIEYFGLNKFNLKSQEMKNISQGRYKRFNKSFDVKTRNELASNVFDNDLLWVLEYTGFIDANQLERLMICFTMRNNSAHPGDAGITSENLISFYSDIKTIIFENEKFQNRSI
jgi:hypothetical protein